MGAIRIGEAGGPVVAPTPTAGRSVDRAALLGTSLAAVVALTFGGQGPWEWLASVVGLALLTVLLGYFRLPDGEPAPRRERLAVSAVSALCATLVVAPGLQAFLAVATPVGGDCADVGAVASAVVVAQPVGLTPSVVRAAATQAAETAYGDCLGATTNRWLWAPALVLAALGYAATAVVGARRSRSGGRAENHALAERDDRGDEQGPS